MMGFALQGAAWFRQAERLISGPNGLGPSAEFAIPTTQRSALRSHQLCECTCVVLGVFDSSICGVNAHLTLLEAGAKTFFAPSQAEDSGVPSGADCSAPMSPGRLFEISG